MSGYLRKMARKQMRANRGLMNRVRREHEDVLQNIEFVLVVAYRHIEEIDDRLCYDAIESVLTGQAPRHPLAAMLTANLRRMRESRQDVTDLFWQDALRVVAQSIRRHSTCQPGEIGYLAFADMFIL